MSEDAVDEKMMVLGGGGVEVIARLLAVLLLPAITGQVSGVCLGRARPVPPDRPSAACLPFLAFPSPPSSPPRRRQNHKAVPFSGGTIPLISALSPHRIHCKGFALHKTHARSSSTMTRRVDALMTHSVMYRERERERHDRPRLTVARLVGSLGCAPSSRPSSSLLHCCTSPRLLGCFSPLGNSALAGTLHRS